ncbi:hypothetical protein ACHAQA_003153 [Verticillium albo-atrum]
MALGIDVTAGGGNGGIVTLSAADRFRKFTPMVVFITMYMALASFNFGFDVGTFGGVQGMQPFAKRFGKWDEKIQLYALPASLSAIMTATPFLGKLVGVIACGPVAERWGRKKAMLILAIVSLVGCTLQTSAHSAAQFTAGRIINFATTGMCIVVVPIYQSECAPKELRGLIGSTLQLTISFGSFVASLVNLGTKSISSDASWLIPTGLQLVVPVIILALLPFAPESPRWLLSKGRIDEAQQSLHRLRGKGVSEDTVRSEIEELHAASANKEKGTWAEVFDKANRKRTGVAMLAMVGQQITGQAFLSQYNIIFYQRFGFAKQAFTFGVISSVLGLVAIVMTWALVDGLGRRPILLTGGSLMAVFLYCVGIIATIPSPSQGAQNFMVASLMLYGVMYSLSWAPISYIVVGECSSSRVKEKTTLLAGSASVLTTFVTSYTLPYLLNPPYAALGGKVGYIYGSTCLICAVLAAFFIPEMKGRSLEEVDQLFAMGVPLWKFKGTQVPHSGSQAGSHTESIDEQPEVAKIPTQIISQEK